MCETAGVNGTLCKGPPDSHDCLATFPHKNDKTNKYEGGFICSCKHEYKLETDQVTCARKFNFESKFSIQF